MVTTKEKIRPAAFNENSKSLLLLVRKIKDIRKGEAKLERRSRIAVRCWERGLFSGRFAKSTEGAEQPKGRRAEEGRAGSRPFSLASFWILSF